MAAAAQTVPNYCTLITKSRLLTPEQVKEAYRSWQEAAGGNGEADSESLRKFLVSRKLLTEYQSHLLMRGHADGYFIDNYKILDLISKGSQTGTYRAIHSSGQVVAIKVLPPKKAKDPMVLSRFQREGKLLTKLDHPNVVRAFQVGMANGRHYLVMEHFESESLEEVMDRRKRLAPPEAVRIIHQVLQGLQHVFEKGMVHRDLNLGSLVLAPPARGANETTLGSTVKIVELGLGRTTFDESKQDDETPLTIEGSLLGSADYVSPEQARNAHEADIRSDIYSAGCILYHMITGQVPFPETNMLAQIVKHATENARPLNQFVPGIPDSLQQVVNWMMAKDPNQRYPTPALAAQSLQAFLPSTQEKAPLASPLPAYMKYLESTTEFEPPKPAPSAPIPEWAAGQVSAPAPSNIPVGRMEEQKRKPAAKKDGTGQKPRLGAASGPAAPSAGMEEYDVEIVGTAPPTSFPPPVIEPLTPGKPKLPSESGEERGLLELDRRDYIMASAGGGIVAVAMLLGYGVSRLLRGSSSPAATTPTETTQQQEPARLPPRKPIEKTPEKPPEDPREEMKKEEPKAEEPKTEGA